MPAKRKAKSSSYRHGDLRNALIAEGRRALEKMSPHELSLRHLARAVGVTEAAPARHFAGKEALLAAIASCGFRELAAMRAEIALSDATALAKTYEMMNVYVDFAQRQKGLFDLMIGPRIIARDAHAELKEESSRSFRLFATAVENLATESGWPSHQLDRVIHAAWGLEHGVATLILSDRVPRHDMPIRLDEFVQFSITALLSAIAAGPRQFETIATRLSEHRKATLARSTEAKSRKPNRIGNKRHSEAT